MTYFITFACYGCHLHGDELGSVDKHHNPPGSRLVEAAPRRAAVERQRTDQPPYDMDETRRDAVLSSMLERCLTNGWSLLAAHVGTNHVHLVIDAEAKPKRVMNDLKSYASRYLNQLGLDEPTRKRWSRHGSTLWLWKLGQVSAGIRYVVDEQGDPMAVLESTER
jgi:REP element-mobilizing transposase RayT